MSGILWSVSRRRFGRESPRIAPSEHQNVNGGRRVRDREFRGDCEGDGYLIGEIMTVSIAFVNSLSIFRTSWQAEYYRKDWLTAYYRISGVPTPLFFHESWHGLIRALNIIITYLSEGYNRRLARRHLPTCSGFH